MTMYPKYRIDKEKDKFVVRKFTGFDHSWAEYSKPLEIFDTEKEAQAYIGDKLLAPNQPTKADKEKIMDDMQPRFGEPISEWYRYFAWRPISTLDRGYRWFWIVWKRKCQPHDYLSGPMTPFYQYRANQPTKDNKEK